MTSPSTDTRVSAELLEALEECVGALIGANALLNALAGRPSIAIETSIERGNRALTKARAAS
jgi:hypothetical protein